MLSIAGMQYATPKTWIHVSLTSGVLECIRKTGILMPLPKRDANSKNRAKPQEKPNLVKAVLATPRKRKLTTTNNRNDSNSMKKMLSGL